MRLVIQRAARASVEVEGQTVGAIEKGLLVFLGVHRDDQEKEMDWFIEKLLNLRIFEDEAGKMNLSVQDIEGGILVVSQFTLYANCKGGRRPDFLEAAPPDKAEPFYQTFVERLKGRYPRVETGRFAAHMGVNLVNDGPVTIIL